MKPAFWYLFFLRRSVRAIRAPCWATVLAAGGLQPINPGVESAQSGKSEARLTCYTNT